MPDLRDFAAVAVKPPTEQDFATAAAIQRREMGAAFDQVFTSQGMGEAVRKLHQKRNEEQRRLSRAGWRPVSILNLMPFALNVNGVLHARLAEDGINQVPACPVGQPFFHKIIREPQWSISDEGAGMDNVDNYRPIYHIPMEMAEDYTNEFLDRMNVGGLVIYEGDYPPDTPGLKKKIEEARRARNKWLLKKVHEAEAEWADTSGRGRKNITELHRKAAEVLLHEKILKHQPAWLLATNSEGGEAPDPCPGCGAVSEAKTIICKNCSYVYRPLDAFKATLISYEHVAMGRLSAEEWAIANDVKSKRDAARKAGSGKKQD